MPDRSYTLITEISVKKILPLLTLVGALDAIAQEVEEPSYTYVSLEHEYSNVHEGSQGTTLGYSVELDDRFHVFGGWNKADLDLAEGVDATRLGYLVGVGVKQRILGGGQYSFAPATWTPRRTSTYAPSGSNRPSRTTATTLRSEFAPCYGRSGKWSAGWRRRM